MYEFIHVFGIVLFAAGPHIPLSVKPQSVVGIECPNPDIELAAIVEHWIDVFLHDKGLMFGEGDQRLGEMLDE